MTFSLFSKDDRLLSFFGIQNYVRWTMRFQLRLYDLDRPTDLDITQGTPWPGRRVLTALPAPSAHPTRSFLALPREIPSLILADRQQACRSRAAQASYDQHREIVGQEGCLGIQLLTRRCIMKPIEEKGSRWSHWRLPLSAPHWLYLVSAFWR
jgi:hypothetical protein